MTLERHIRLLRAWLGCLIGIGLLALAYALIWVPVRHATLVDVILTPAERRDPAKVDVEYRSLRYKSRLAHESTWIYATIGAAVAGLASAALIVVGRAAGSRDAA
jgi:hypothetical protein